MTIPEGLAPVRNFGRCTRNLADLARLMFAIRSLRATPALWMAGLREKSFISTWTRFRIGGVADDPRLRRRPVTVGYANARRRVAERPRLGWL